jgi:hypothetical protein
VYYAFTGNLDLTAPGKSKRIHAIHCAATAAAVVNIRDGAVGGPIIVQLQIPINTSKEVVYSAPPGLAVPGGVFVHVASGTVVGSVDLL